MYKVRLVQAIFVIFVSVVLVYGLLKIQRQVFRGGLIVCAKICSWRVSVSSEVSFFIEMVFFLATYIASFMGLWKNFGQADAMSMICYVFPLAICTYFVAFPFVFLYSELFYVKSDNLWCTGFKSLLALLAAFIWCYGQQHNVRVDGKLYLEEKIDGIDIMPVAMVLPLLPVVQALTDMAYKKLEDPARANRPKVLAIGN
jgi:hypothetical protein